MTGKGHSERYAAQWKAQRQRLRELRATSTDPDVLWLLDLVEQRGRYIHRLNRASGKRTRELRWLRTNYSSLKGER